MTVEYRARCNIAYDETVGDVTRIVVLRRGEVGAVPDGVAKIYPNDLIPVSAPVVETEVEPEVQQTPITEKKKSPAKK